MSGESSTDPKIQDMSLRFTSLEMKFAEMFVCQNDTLHRGFLCNKVARHATLGLFAPLGSHAPRLGESNAMLRRLQDTA